VRARRTSLTVPASSLRMLEKAAMLPADEIVVDLEDFVAAAVNERARENLAAARARGTLAVRVHAVGSPWFEADLEAVAAVKPDVVVLPKAELASLDAVAGLPLEVQIETTRALVVGPGDFAASLGVPVLTIGRGASEYALARIAVAARAYGAQPIDGPYAV